MKVVNLFIIIFTFILSCSLKKTLGKVMNAHPIVDAGLFVISGVMTCGEGHGYCLLGLDCTLDEEFLPDPSGHCKGLQNAFTPSAYFSCCKYKNLTGQDNFIYTMADPAITSLVNGNTESSTLKETNTKNKISEIIKHSDNVQEDKIFLEKFNKHMEKVKLKNEDKIESNNVPSYEIIKPETIVDMLNENVVVTSENEDETKEEEDDDDDDDDDDDEDEDEDDDEEEDENDSESEQNNDIKTIQLGNNSKDRDEKGTNENDDYYDSKEDTSINMIKECHPHDTTHSHDITHENKVKTISDHILEPSKTVPITPDTVVNNLKLFLSHNNPTKKPNKHNNKPTANNVIQNDNIEKDQNKITTNINDFKQQYPYDQHATSEKLCMRSNNASKCRVVWKFIYKTKTICSGTMLDQIWMLTSATCVERLVHFGLENITVESHKDWRISNVVAYEEFRSEHNHTHHDIGLVRLMIPIQRSVCVPCIPKLNQKFTGSDCSAPYSSSNSQISGNSLQCQGLSESYNSHGDDFMSLACRNPSGSQNSSHDWNVGNGILCRGYIAGLQTKMKSEQLIYLPINKYVNWIQQNMKSLSISQKYQLGRSS